MSYLLEAYQGRLFKYAVPGDGHCLFHSLLWTFNSTYRVSSPASRRRLVVQLRADLAQRLPQYFPQLQGGSLANFAQSVGSNSAGGCSEYSLAGMQAILNSNSILGYGFMDFLGQVLDLDIYVINAQTMDIYDSTGQELRYSITGKRRVVMLLFSDNHYEPLGISDAAGQIVTLFRADSSLARLLYQRVQRLR